GLIALYGLHWWRYLHAHVSTDDAYVAGRIAPISARVAGHVTDVVVSDNQEGRAGEVLVRLDTSDSNVALAATRASEGPARAGAQNAPINVPLTDETTRSAATQADAALAAVEQAAEMARHDLEQRRGERRAREAAVAAAEAGVRAAEAEHERARTDRDRLA